MDSIMLEIRTHLEEAKQEITILQRQYEQRLLRQSVKLGLAKKEQSMPGSRAGSPSHAHMSSQGRIIVREGGEEIELII